MQRRHFTLPSLAVGRDVNVLAFGHYGTPIIAFPSGGGQYFDFEDNGMVDAVAHLIDGGKLKLYCPESVDNESWLRGDIDPHWKAVRYNAYQDFLTHDLVPAIRGDCNDDSIQIGLTGCSIGAFHAANFGLKLPHLFPYALCMSGRYNVAAFGGHSDSSEVYFNNPLAYLPNLGSGDLEHVRYHAHIALVCGQGAWEWKCLEDTHRLADLLRDKGISHERDVWGHDVEHHWYWWQRQFAHHLDRALG